MTHVNMCHFMPAEDHLLTSDGAMANEALTQTAAATLIAHLRKASAMPLPCRKLLTSALFRHHKATHAHGSKLPH